MPKGQKSDKNKLFLHSHYENVYFYILFYVTITYYFDKLKY